MNKKQRKRKEKKAKKEARAAKLKLMLTKAESANDKPAKESGNKQGNAEALKEQPISRWLRFWKWVTTVTVAEVVTVLLTATIAGTTIYYTIYSKKQWQIARDTLKISQGAYVTIGRKDGVVANFTVPKDHKQKAQLIMYFQNSGHVPAKIAWGTFGPAFIEGGPPLPKSSGITFTHPYKGMARTRAKDGSISENGESAAVAGDSILVATLGEIAQDRLIALAAQSEGPLIMGMYRYCDQLGTDTTHHFSLGWHDVGDSNLNFYLVEDGLFPMPKPVNTTDIEYLPPCETSKQMK